MGAIVKEAIRAGALGFSTSRTIAHRAIDGEPVPGTYAAEDELFGIGAALGELGTGIFELAPAGVAGEDVIAPVKEVDWMRRLSVAIGRPVTFALLQIDDAPDLWRELMDESLRAAEEGAQLWPQVAARATGLLTGLHSSYCLFDSIPAYQALKARNLTDDQLVRGPVGPVGARRHRVVPARARAPWRARTCLRGQLRPRHPTELRARPRELTGADRGRGGAASARGRLRGHARTDDGHGLLYFPILNYSSMSLEPVREMLLHPRAVAGLGDGGAHCGVICDSPQPTFMLSHWTRDRTRGALLPLEWVVKKQTHDTASLYGLGDRGTLEPGLLADLNVIDYDHLQLGTPKVVTDLPAGGRRLVQDAVGYLATIKSGVTTFEHGTETGARPGCSYAVPAEGSAGAVLEDVAQDPRVLVGVEQHEIDQQRPHRPAVGAEPPP